MHLFLVTAISTTILDDDFDYSTNFYKIIIARLLQRAVLWPMFLVAYGLVALSVYGTLLILSFST